MENLCAEMAMNLIGLVLIAALSSGIVAVSLRLRASASSTRMRPDRDRLPEHDRQQQVQSGTRVALRQPG